MGIKFREGLFSGIFNFAITTKTREIKNHYYSTIMSFYQIRSRERAKYEAVIHCSVLV